MQVSSAAGSQRPRALKAAEWIASQVRRDILLGVVKEGDPMPGDSALMEQYSVSRPTLREAYRILESEGLLSISRGAHGGGRVHVPSGQVAARYAAFVLQFRGTSLAEIYEARTMLEVQAAVMAACRRTRSDLKRLRLANERAEAAIDDGDVVLEMHHQFHAVLTEIAGNRAIVLLADMIDSILDKADVRHMEARVSSDERRKASVEAQADHTELLARITDKDVDGAEELWRRHCEKATKLLLRNTGAKTALEATE